MSSLFACSVLPDALVSHHSLLGIWPLDPLQRRLSLCLSDLSHSLTQSRALPRCLGGHCWPSAGFLLHLHGQLSPHAHRRIAHTGSRPYRQQSAQSSHAWRLSSCEQISQRRRTLHRYSPPVNQCERPFVTFLRAFCQPDHKVDSIYDHGPHASSGDRLSKN